MTKEQKNHQAYDDCALCLEPSMPHDAEYMESYRYWRAIAKFPGDDYDLL